MKLRKLSGGVLEVEGKVAVKNGAEIEVDVVMKAYPCCQTGKSRCRCHHDCGSPLVHVRKL